VLSRDALLLSKNRTDFGQSAEDTPARRRHNTAVASALPGGAQPLGRAKPTRLGDVKHHAVRA
jgi:hypothetical protein